ncbi:aspartic proteinase nepenthesin-1-like [Ananas comosus]|uniref:nepenthesin n=1 Tax=Ananas comosus TaxID=4615 RepID=A0A6P5FCL0_ANACO|nr:aspartic proteinase nepenthesin-1-like [Ananas comosus]
MLQLLFFVLLSLIPYVIPTSFDIRLDLKHVDADSGLTRVELLRRAALRGKSRATSLIHNSTINAPVQSNGAEYLVELAIGSPAQPVMLILDTGSDLIWTQCQPCLECFNQSLSLYAPSNSSTFSRLSCSSKLCRALSLSACHGLCMYMYGYSDKSTTIGVLGAETFTFGTTTKKVKIPRLGFGCGILNQGIFLTESGIAGFGRGPLSLISQLKSKKFSYCFTPIHDYKRSTLFFGTLANPKKIRSGSIKTTPLIKNPLRPSLYYLSLNGITVGNKRLKIPKSAFTIKENGNGGVIIDSGTGFTRLNRVAHDQVKSAFASQLKLSVINDSTGTFDVCFSVPISSYLRVEVPKLIYHFEGADMDVPRDNYVVDLDEGGGLMCLLVSKSKSNDVSIIGNIHQQNMWIEYDLEKNELGFAPAQCDQL